jgi:hypothetical protein
MLASYSVATDVIENPSYSREARDHTWSEVVVSIAKFTDENWLYLNENLIVHCMTTLVGVEDIYYIEAPEEKKKQIKTFAEGQANAKKMIKKETGLEALDKLFGSISSAKHESDYISYYKQLRK